MKPLFAAVLVVHGLIHLMGAAKASRLAALPQVTQPISSAMGLAWLLAAVLFLGTAGALFAFWSDDRRQTLPDGKTMRAIRWSTPFGSYRAFGAFRLGTRGEARWHEAAGDYAYIQIDVDEVLYNAPGR
jgi:hypothetical protein